MNGDAGKLPASAVYSATSPEPNATGSAISGQIPVQIIPPQNLTEFSNMNGAEGTEFYVAQDNSSITSNENIISTPDGNPIPLEQLKQLLSSQLEYYFSR